MEGDEDAGRGGPLQPQHFDPHVGAIFRFQGAHQALALNRVLREPRSPDGRAPFTLIFHGPKDSDPLPEGLYVCQSESGLRVDLYLSPIHTPAPDRQDYQAVFN